MNNDAKQNSNARRRGVHTWERLAEQMAAEVEETPQARERHDIVAACALLLKAQASLVEDYTTQGRRLFYLCVRVGTHLVERYNELVIEESNARRQEVDGSITTEAIKTLDAARTRAEAEFAFDRDDGVRGGHTHKWHALLILGNAIHYLKFGRCEPLSYHHYEPVFTREGANYQDGRVPPWRLNS